MSASYDDPVMLGGRSEKPADDADATNITGFMPNGGSHYWCRPMERHQSMDLEDYFVGPHDPTHHSKWPFFLRLHGSVLPKMILPLLVVGAWATFIACFSKYVEGLGISSVTLTVLGFVVGLSLSFRCTTAYERYNEGRKYWSTLNQAARNLARTIWIHIDEREGEEGKDDLLAKLTAINLILAFAVSLKHKLRFEPSVGYEDLSGLIDHLNTFAQSARVVPLKKKPSTWKNVGEYLGIPFAESNPRKAIKRTKEPLGHLPLEVLNYLSAYVEDTIRKGTLKVPVIQTQVMNYLTQLSDCLSGTERILNTPLPLAYNIAISQITWIYILLLPFQLYPTLTWVTIPVSILAAYIILGLAAIGREIEDPFGHDVNDLPLDHFCRQIASDLDVIISFPCSEFEEFMQSSDNHVLFPLSMDGYDVWKRKNIQQIRSAVRNKVVTASECNTREGSICTAEGVLPTGDAESESDSESASESKRTKVNDVKRGGDCAV